MARTAVAGRSRDLSASLVFNASQEEDRDFDGLPDDIELVIGTGIDLKDTDGDGISDFVEIASGLDPLGGQGFSTGIIASLPLQGEAKGVTVTMTPDRQQLAYVATGSHGLAIIDISQFNNPIILGQLDLPGDATDVALDSALGLAAVATNSGGLHLVDISDPMLPRLHNTFAVDTPQIELFNGIVYAAVGNSLEAIDLFTGDVLQTIDLPGGGSIIDMDSLGTNLYAFSSGSQTLSIINISNGGFANTIGQLDSIPISAIAIRFCHHRCCLFRGVQCKYS